MTNILLAVILITILLIIYSIKSIKTNVQNFRVIESNQNRVNIVLSNIPENQKIEVLKIVRTNMNLGLKEAKDLIESSIPIKINNIDYDFALNTKNKLERYGAKVEIEMI